MKAYDFEYDGNNLSDFGYMVCKFGSNGLETVSNGAEITFNTLSTFRGEKHELTHVEYADCLSTVIQICKNPCSNENEEMSVDDVRLLSRWLNRKGFYKFKILNEQYLGFYFEASFNIKRIEFNGSIIGLELDVITNRPFALHDALAIVLRTTNESKDHVVQDASDTTGYVYPRMEISVLEDGELDIYNEMEDRHTIIQNCKAGELIKMDYPIIETSDNTHMIQNDFNWNFFRLANSYRARGNKIHVSLPSVIKIVYSPNAHVGL